MRVQEQRILKIPIDELRELLKKSHGVDLSGVEPFIEGEYLAFSLDVAEGRVPHARLDTRSTVERRAPRARRRRKKRNRVRTRGWKVIAKIENSQGLTANIYEPFVKALGEKPLPKSEQRRVVRQIMVDNGNRPTDQSVEYFLTNTLQYMASKK